MRKILVVDDNQLILKSVELYLRGAGYEVYISRTPFGILARIKDVRPDMILLDVNMPGMSGQSVAGLLKTLPWNDNCKVVFFSSADKSLLQGMVDDGLADGYYYKGRAFDGLAAYVNELFEGSSVEMR